MKRKILYLLIIFLSFLVYNPTYAQGPGASWTYSRQITLSPVTPDANYQVEITLTTAIMGNPYTNVNTSGNDIRFYDNNNNPCNYWFETWTATGTSTIWVKVPTSGATSLTMYYGNASATAASNGAGVFDFFDNFAGSSLAANWTATTSGGTITVASNSVTLANTNAGTVEISSAYTPSISSYLVEVKHSEGSYWRNRFYATTALNGGAPSPITDYGYFNSNATAASYNSAQLYWNGTWETGTAVTAGTNYLSRWQITDGSTYNWSNYTYSTMAALGSTYSATVTTDCRYISILVTEEAGTSTTVDWVRVRQYAASVPGGTVGSQVTNSALAVSATSLAFGNQLSGTTSTSQSINLTGARLTGSPGNITVTAPNTNFEVSNNNSTWGATATIAYSSATLAATPVYVMFTPQTEGAQSGNITFSGGGATGTPTVAVTGTGTAVMTSDVIANPAYTYTSNIPYISYQTASPTTLTTATSVGVMGLIIQDAGTSLPDPDNLSTTLTNITFSTGGSTAIRTAALFNGTTNVGEVAVNGATSFSFSGLTLTAPNNSTLDFELRVTFESTVTDQQQIQYSVTSVTASSAGNGFAAANGGGAASAITGSDNVINVTASKLVFTQQPSNVNQYAAMSPAVTITAEDANNNTDINYATNVSLSTTATFAGTAVTTVTPVSGVATFSNLTFSAAATNRTIAATSGSLTGTGNSSTFTVSAYATATSDYFQSNIASGIWTTGGNWQSSHDNVNWFTSTLAPTSAAAAINIQTGNTIYVTATPSYANLTVNGTYQHEFNGGTIPTATWNSGSTLLITGATGSTAPGGLGQSFYNVTWDWTTQNANINLAGALTTVNGTLTIESTNASYLSISNSATATINVGDFSQTGGTFYLNDGGGTDITTMNISGNWSLTGGTFTSTSTSQSTVNFDGSSAQTISGTSTTTFYNFTINETASATTVTSSGNAFAVGGALTITEGNLILTSTNANYNVTGNLVVSTNGTLTHSVSWNTYGKALVVGGNISVSGLYTYTVRSTLEMSGPGTTVTSGSTPGSAFDIFLLINTSGTISASGPVNINDNFWAAYVTTGGTFSTNGQNVTGIGGLINCGGTVDINGGSLTITGGLYVGESGQTPAGNVVLSSGTLTVDAVTIGVAGGATGTLSVSGGIADIGSITINSTGTVTVTNSPAINVTGTWTNDGTYTKGAETVTLDGNSAQTVGGTVATTFDNLNMDNAAGATLGNNEAVSGTLTFTNGIISTGTNTLTLGVAGTAGTVAGTPGSTSYVYGNLQRYINNVSAPSVTFNIGDASIYAPVTVAFAGTTSGSGSVTMSTTPGNDPNENTPVTNSSGINQTEKVNRYWTMTNSGVSGFTSYSGTYNFATSDILNSANPLTFVIRKYNAGWAAVTNGTLTSNSSQAIGMTTFGDIEIGEKGSTSVATNPDDTTVCAGSNVTFSSSSTSNPSPSIQWQRSSNGGSTYTNITANLDAGTTYSGFNSGTLTLTGSTTALSGYLYQAVFTNINGTAVSTAASLTVNPIPGDDAGSNVSFCNGSSTVIGASSTAGNTYLWSPTSNLSSSTVSNPTANPSSTTIYTLQETITSTGCSVSNSVTVTVNAIPVATANPSAPTVCSGIATNIALSSTVTGTTYAWSVTEGSGISNGSSGTGSPIAQTLLNSNTSAGTATYNIVPTGPSPTYCVGSSINATVTVNPAPALTNSTTASICTVNSPDITLTSNIPSSFAWTLGTVTGGITGASNGSGTTINQTLTNPSDATAGTVPYIVTPTATTGSCAGSPTTITVTVNPKPAVTNAATASTCSGSGPNITLTASAASSFTWTLGTTTGGITGASASSGGTINQTLSNPSNASAGTVQYLVTPTSTAGSCTGSASTITVTVDPIPAVTNAATATICSGSSPNITLTASAASSFSWTIGTVTGSITGASNSSGGTINQTLTNLSNATAGSVQYLVTPTSTTGSCAGSPYTITVTVNPKPGDNSGANQTICDGSNTVIGAASTSGHTYSWSPSSTLSSSTVSNPTATPTTTTTYTLVETITATGCSVSNTTVITVNPVIANNTVTAAQTICYGSTPAALTGSTPTGGTGTYAYLWESSTTSATSGFSAASGTDNTQSYSPPALALNTWYLRTVTSGACSSTSSAILVTVDTIPVVTITTNYCDTSGYVKLTSSSGSTYLWSTGGTTQSVLVDEAGIYLVTVSNSYGCTSSNSTTVAVELVTNGNFMAGNTGFTSGYTHIDDYYVTGNDTTGLWPQGLYAIGTNAHDYHPVFYGESQTNPGVDSFMMVNGESGGTTPTVWQETVTVQANTVYYFSAWAMSLDDVPPYAQLQFSVNGTQVGTIAVLTAGATSTSGPFIWTRFYATWNSGSVTSVTLAIVDLDTVADGNDFALDNISCSTLAPLTFSIAPAAPFSTVCQGDPIDLYSNVSGGSSPFTYSWSGPNSFTSDSSDPVILNSTTAMSGTYSVTVTNGYGCTANGSASITVGTYPTNVTATAQASSVCSGTATNILVASSQTSVSYQLINDTTNAYIGNAVTGTGSTIDLPTGDLTANTTFGVIATNTTTGCSIQLSSTPAVSVLTTPVLEITNQAACSSAVNLEAAAVTAGSTPTSGATLSYWTNSTATTALSNPTAVSTSGTYYIKSTVGTCTDIAPVVVTISEHPVATFSYTGTPYCSSSSNPSPTFSGGGTAGTFSCTNSGLVFVSTSTGQINLSASTPGTYTVKNTITPSGTGCSATSATSSVTITALPSASFSYSSNALCQAADANNPTPVLASGATAGTFSSSYGLTFVSTSTGEIDLAASTPDNYAVTNTVAAASGCSAVSSTSYININAYSFTGSVTASASPDTICDGQNTALTLSVPSYLSALMREDFNGTNDWTTINNSTGGTPANAAWTLESNGYTYNTNEFISYDYNQFYLSNSNSQGVGGTTSTILQSPSMSSVGYTTLALDFFTYFDYSTGSTAKVQVSIDSVVWATLATYTSTLGNDGNFTDEVVNLGAYINQSKLYIRFVYNASDGDYWAIGNVNVTGYSTNYTYQWSSSPSGYTSTSQDPSGIAPTTNTSYTAVATNSYGCASNSSSVAVVVNPLPTVTNSSAYSTCSGTSPDIALTASIPSSFTWTIGTITGGITGASASSGATINQTLTNPSSTTAGTVQYLVTPTSTTGSCAGSAYTITVTVNPAPALTNSTTASICTASSPGITLTSSIASSFAWTLGTITGGITGASNGSGGTINQTLTNPSDAAAGTVPYIVTPTATTGSCAGSPTTITVTVNPKPAVTNAATASTCSGSGPNITLTASATSSFAWTIGTITGSITGASNSSGGTINQTLSNPSNASAGTVQYLVTPTSTTGSCPGSASTITVTVNPTPSVTNSGTASTCSGTGPVITLTSSAASSFTWTIGTITGGITGASPGSGGAINQTLSNPSNTTGGTVQYLVTPTSTTGSCPGSASTITVTVNPAPTVTNPATESICNGTSTNLALTSSISSSYAWTIGTITGGITGASASSGGTINQTLINPSNLNAGTVQYLVTPTSTATSCAGSAYAITVTVNPAPAVTNAATASTCSGASPDITLTASVPGSFTWTIGSITGNITGAASGSGGTINQTLTNPSNSSAGTVQYIVTPTATTGSCPGSASAITVTVNPLPGDNAGANQSVCLGSGVIIGGASTTGDTYSWSPTAGLSSSVISNPTASPGSNTTYTLTETITSTGCSASNSTIVTVNPLPSDEPVTPEDSIVCYGTSTYIQVANSVSGVNYQLRLNSNNSDVGSAVGGDGSTTNLSTGNLTIATSFNVLATISATGCSAQMSDTAIVQVAVPGTWLGLVSTAWNDTNNWCSGVPTSITNVIIPAGTTYSPIISTTAASNNIAIESGNSLTIITGGDLSLYGNLVVNGVYSQPAGTLELVGSSNQSIPAITTYNVIVNNSTGVTLSGNLTVTDSLTLTNGIITTGTDSVIALDTLVGSVNTGSATAYVNGNLERAVGDTGLYAFPVGDTSYYQLATVQLIANSRRIETGINTLTAFFTRVNSVNCTNVTESPITVNGTLISGMLDGGFWTIHPDTSVYSGISYDVTLYETGYNNAPPLAGQMAVVKRANCSSYWQALGTHNNNTQSIESGTAIAVNTALTSFSDFGIGFGGDYSLPVELIYLEANPVNNQFIQVSWATDVEINDAGFKVMRSTDGVTFDQIAWVPGHGNSTTTETYVSNDSQALPGIRYYYKLIQVDNNGASKETDVVTAMLTGSGEFVISDFIPNPANGNTYLSITSSANVEVGVEIYDITGRKVMSGNYQIGISADNKLTFDLNKFAAGTYSAIITSANGMFAKKLVIAR